jgi:hypothetical protein
MFATSSSDAKFAQNTKEIECGENAQSKKKLLIPYSTYLLSQDEDTAWALVEVIVNWVDHEYSISNNRNNSIPLCAVQLYCANHYYCHVRDLGHKGFIKETTNKAGQIWPFVLAGLMNMKADNFVSIFREMADWVSQNIDVAAAIENNDESIIELLSLDAKFELAHMQSPFHSLATNWIKQWSDIEIISDEDFVSAREEI